MFITSLFPWVQSPGMLTESSVQGLTRLWSRCWLGCILIWGSTGKEATSKLKQAVCRIHFLEAAWLRALASHRSRDHPELFNHMALVNMTTYIVKPIRRISSSILLWWSLRERNILQKWQLIQSHSTVRRKSQVLFTLQWKDLHKGEDTRRKELLEVTLGSIYHSCLRESSVSNQFTTLIDLICLFPHSLIIINKYLHLLLTTNRISCICQGGRKNMI